MVVDGSLATAVSKLRKAMGGVAGLLATDKETALLGKIDALTRGSTAAMEAALKDSRAGLDTLAKMSADQFEDVSKRIGAGQAEVMNRLQAAFLDEMQKLRQDSNARLRRQFPVGAIRRAQLRFRDLNWIVDRIAHE